MDIEAGGSMPRNQQHEVGMVVGSNLPLAEYFISESPLIITSAVIFRDV